VAFSSIRKPTGQSDVLLFRLDADFVIDGGAKSLIAAEVLFSGLKAYVSEQELDLLQLSSVHVTQSSTRPSTVMGSDFSKVRPQSESSHNVPHHLFRDAGAPDVSLPAYAAKQAAGLYVGRFGPRINRGAFHLRTPRRD
jgi:hypothetical protein